MLRFRRAIRVACLLCCVSTAAAGPASAATATHLLSVDTIGSQTSGLASPDAPLRVPVTGLRLLFDQPVTLGAADLRLMRIGPDGRFDTDRCALPQGDDEMLPLAAVAPGAQLLERVVSLATATGLPADRYRLLVCDTLAAPVRLDGDADGIPGGDARFDFEIAETPLLPDPGFAADLSHWIVSTWFGDGEVDAALSPHDADGAAGSGALRLATTGTAAVRLAHPGCLASAPARAPGVIDQRLRLRYRLLSGRVVLHAQIGTLFAGDRQDGCDGPGITRAFTLDDVRPASGYATWDIGRQEFAAFPLTVFTLTVVPLDGPFELLLDDVGLTHDPHRIFRAAFD